MQEDLEDSTHHLAHLQQRIRRVLQPFQAPSDAAIDLASYRAACERLADLQV